jgi:pSer/pThr/pTyr-binding forkhead associated (FHA) protein
MRVYLDVWRAHGVQSVPLEGNRATVGADPSNDVCIDADGAVSRLHAVIENYGAGWAIRDLGSRNGTYVNGDRALGERALRPGDEVRIGNTRLFFRERGPAGREARNTQVLSADPNPDLTRRERDVLRALCRPLASSDAFRQPASIKAIARELVVTEATVKQHLLNLYDKFGLNDPRENRRLRLANDVILRGLLSPIELQGD